MPRPTRLGGDTVGSRIRAHVARRGWTFKHAAELADMSPQQLSDIVADRASPTVTTMARLAAAWGTGVRNLIP